MKVKNMILLISFIVFMSSVAGCSARSWYEGGQLSAEHRCHNMPLSEREQCLQNINNKAYKDYVER
jgi:hypothetical protein